MVINAVLFYRHQNDFPGDVMNRYLRRIFVLFSASVLFFFTSSASALHFETEPNDAPEQALVISGEMNVFGHLDSGDVDTFIWEATDAHTGRAWELQFEGVAGAETTLQLSLLDDGDGGGQAEMFTLNDPSGIRTVTTNQLMFSPGRYCVQVRGTSAGSYKIRILPGDGIGVGKSVETNISRDKAHKLDPEFDFSRYTEASESWFSWELDTARSAYYWQFSGRVAASDTLTVELLDNTGAVIRKAVSDLFGRLLLAGVSLDPGQYHIRLTHPLGAGGIYEFSGEQCGIPIGEREQEPNEKPAAGNLIDRTHEILGVIQEKGDHDAYRFRVAAGEAHQTFDIVIEGAPDVQFQAALYRGDIKIQSRKAAGTLRFDHLLLQTGVYALVIEAKQFPSDYTLRFTAPAEPSAGAEVEPNDRFDDAAGMGPTHTVTGRFYGQDRDFYRFTTTGAPAIYEITAAGEGIDRLELFNAAGASMAQSPYSAVSAAAKISNIYLREGSHRLALKGGNGEYEITVRSLGEPDPNTEREPNNDDSRAMIISPGQIRTGSLFSDSDRDYYRFFLAAEEHLRLTVTPLSAESELNLELQWDTVRMLQAAPREKNGAVILDTLFPAGEYLFFLRNRTGIGTDYRLALERLDPFFPLKDLEPNNEVYLASPFPGDQVLEGVAGGMQSDRDIYVLPTGDVERTVLFSNIGKMRLSLRNAGDGKRLAISGNNADIFETVLPAGTEMVVELSGKGPYRIPMSFEPAVESSRVADGLKIAAEIDLSAPEIAAYRRQGQRLTGKALVSSREAETITIRVEGVTSHYKWHCLVPDEEYTIAPGATVAIPFTVEIDPDAWADEPVSLWFHATTGEKGKSFQTELSATRDASPAALYTAWPLPEALLGGYNVAAARFGARFLDPGEFHMEYLIDGMTPLREGFSLRPKERDNMPVLDLPGDDPLPVAGFALNPQSREAAPNSLKAFELFASDDGKNWRSVYRGILSPLPHEQAFLFDDPVRAAYFKLDMLSSHRGNARSNIGLGEWKLITPPGFDPFSGRRHDLAAPVNGGHVVWSDPQISIDWDRQVLTGEHEKPYVRIANRKQCEWVVGFEHERAAKIEEIQWGKSEKENEQPDAVFERVMISVSLSSPLGPWERVGVIDPRAGEETVTLTLDTPVWARYVKFSASGGEGLSRCYPEVIRIYEQPVTGTYRSILAEWGHYNTDAVYEYSVPEESASFKDIGPEYGSKERAYGLDMKTEVQGRVALGEREDWFRFTVPADHNTLSMSVKGDPDVRVACALFDAAGVGLALEQTSSPSGAQIYTAEVAGGADYYARITDPPRSIIISWDTSGSVAPYIPVTYNALNRFAMDVTPGLEVINLLPFGGSLLLDEWIDEPLPLQAVLTEYDRRDGSSAAETTLAAASRALAKREGTRAVVFITDAATSRDRKVWPALRKARPQVFALALSSGGSMGDNVFREQDLMQSWARVNSGYYDFVRTQGELDRGFERASTWLRRPAGYALTVSSAHIREPGPGKIKVVTGDAEVTSGGAVELILDASGSMLKRMDGRRRIDIAKEVLSNVVSNQLPPGIPVALRVFGHRKPNACRTDLVSPLVPLDPAELTAEIGGISAMNLAKTPIAESLKLVATDLGKTKGKKSVVVLVTDGEETCDGDPIQEIEGLIEQGFDIRVNIVGFAIDDQALKEQFEQWAASGGGHYFDGSSADELNRAVEQALRIPYSVMDDSGEVVASGIVDGEFLVMPAGEYRVEVQCEPPMTFEKVVVPGDNQVELDLGA